jgi:pilus assembly protein CpaC
MKKHSCLALTLIFMLSTLILPHPTEAQVTQRVEFAQGVGQPIELLVYVNRSSVIQFDRPLARVSLAQPNVAEAVVISPTQLMLNGKVIGTSSLLAWSAEDQERPAAFTVRVAAYLEPMREQIRALFPNENIKIEQVDGRVILSGVASSQRVIDGVLPMFEGMGLKVVNLLGTRGEPVPAQILLQVRVAEVNRRKLRELGASYGWFNPLFPRGQNEVIGGPHTSNPPGSNTTLTNNPLGPNYTFSDMVNLYLFNPSINVSTFIRALQQNNAFRSLAEPNIIAVNGEKASFLAGGEFPYPVVQPSTAGLAISIVFREFGVRLNFTPKVIDENRIRLEMEPEVSSLDFVNALQLSGFRIPALLVRKAATTVELGDGQSFALAGLLSNDVTRVEAKVPLLGDIPILGYLFRSQSYIKNETELVFLCTARVVKPVKPEELPPIPAHEDWKKDGLEGRFGHQVPGTQPGR